MPDENRQRERAERFRSLHEAPLFVLANAWDVASARIFEMAGFQAIGTTSAGIAATLGYPDGQQIGVDATVAVVRCLAERINLPISADIEAGYGNSTDFVVASAKAVSEGGAVGINIEDSAENAEHPFFEAGVQQERIRAIKEFTPGCGIPLFVNARTDVFMLSQESTAIKLKSTIKRANAYVAAGADCIFVPDFEDMDPQSIRTLVEEIDAPINIIAGSNTPSLQKLEEMGVTRISLGPRHMRATFSLLRNIATEIMNEGTFSQLTAETFSYADVNRMFQAAE